MKVREIIKSFEDFLSQQDYEKLPSVGLLVPEFPISFNPSAGMSFVIKIASCTTPIPSIERYYIIDRASRSLDWELVGQFFHSSLFEIMTV